MGVYLFQKKVLEGDYLRSGHIVLEEAVLEKLAKEGNLLSYPFNGSWHYWIVSETFIHLRKSCWRILGSRLEPESPSIEIHCEKR